MAQSGYTPIALYHSNTPGAVPAAGDLVDGELALNIADGYLFFKQSGVVQNLAGLSGYSGYSGYSGAQGPTIYPGAGVAVSTGSAWDTSLSAPSSALVGVSDTQTLSNKTITARVSSSVTIVSPLAWNSDNFDQYAVTAQDSSLTISADAGTPTNGRKIIFRFKDDGTPRALVWTTGVSKGFRQIGVSLPITTVANKILYVGCVYNAADDYWDAVAVAEEA